MAIFTRRILQRLISENCKFFPGGEVRKHLNRLNIAHKEWKLADEWEVVLLNALSKVLSKVGKVEYHKKFGNRPIDIYFESFENPQHNCLAEITAVSDKGLNELNPVEALREQLVTIVTDHGLNPNHFSLYIEDEMIFEKGALLKPKLKLPGPARFPQVILDKQFYNFIDKILEDRQKTRNYVIKKEDAGLSIKYDPNQRGAGTGYRSYDQVFSKTRNAIYRALDEKLTQLQSANFKGPLGIFLCDGSCTLFRDTRLPDGSYTIDDIIKYFLRWNSPIYFVVTFWIKQNPPFRALSSKKSSYQIAFRLYKGQSFTNVKLDIHKILEEMITVMPKPENDALNAFYHLKSKNGKHGRWHFGGRKIKMEKDKVSEVKISARELLELLAGKLQQKEFFERTGFIKSQFGIGLNPFEMALKGGQLIDDVSLEKSDTEDDYWITFKLKGPDPAISPFVVPKFEKT